MLPHSQLSGTFQITSKVPGTRGVRIPSNAQEPAQVSVKNGDASAVLFCKWVPIAQTSGGVTTSDAGVRLEAYESYTWDHPPGNCDLMIISTVDQSKAHIEAVWAVSPHAVLI